MSLAAQMFLRDTKRESAEGSKIPRALGWEPSFLKEGLFMIYVCMYLFILRRGRGKEIGKRTNSELSFPNSKKKYHHLLSRPKAEWQEWMPGNESAAWKFRLFFLCSFFQLVFTEMLKRLNTHGIHQCLLQSWCLSLHNSPRAGSSRESQVGSQTGREK